MEKSVNISKFLTSVAVGVLCVSGPAMAGFEWSPTVKNVQVSQDPIVAVIAEELAPVQQIERVAVERVASLSPAATVKTEMDVIEGFGRDVPLSYALTSIVPSRYGYAFGADVNPALPITWRGGKPWDDVVREALAPHGLFLHVGIQKVSIQTASVVTPAIIPGLKVSRTFSSEVQTEEVVPNATFKEVYVRRGSDVAVEPTAAKEETPVAEPMSIIEETVEEEVIEEPAADVVSEVVAPVEDVMEEVVIKRINPDIPVSVASYQSASSDENVFEMVMSERENVQVLDTKKIARFHAKRGKTVRETLEVWSDEANVQVYWETPYDFPVEKDMALMATYPMAVQALLGRYQNHDPKPAVKLHPNWPHGPSILTIK